MSERSVSVLICCYNHEQYAIEALDSVARQTRSPDQLIITDDASSDKSAEVIQEWIENHWPTAELVRNEENMGLPGTLNSVLSKLNGDLVAIMSADDVMVEDRIERQVASFASGSDRLGMVYGDMIEIDTDGRPTGQRWFDDDRMGPASEGNLFATMIKRAFISAPTVMVRRDLYAKAGTYDESMAAEDYDMFLRFSRHAEWAYLEEPLVNYRVLPSSLSRTDAFRKPFRENRIRLLRKHIGASPSTDLTIARRTAQMAESLYNEGRSPSSTAEDLRFALGIRFSPRWAFFWAVAMLRVPGPALLRIRQRAVALRHQLLKPNFSARQTRVRDSE